METASTDREWLYSEESKSLLAEAGLTYEDFVALEGIARTDSGNIFVWTRENGSSFNHSDAINAPNLLRTRAGDDPHYQEYWFAPLAKRWMWWN